MSEFNKNGRTDFPEVVDIKPSIKTSPREEVQDKVDVVKQHEKKPFNPRSIYRAQFINLNPNR